MKPLAILVLFTAFFQLQSKAVDLVEYKNLKELTRVTDQNIIAAYKAFYDFEHNSRFIGKDMLTSYSVSSNYDGKWYKQSKQEIQLAEPMSEEFIKWVTKVKPMTLVYQPIDKNGETVFELIGYSKKALHIPPHDSLFPEFKGINLINFDLEENQGELKKRKLIAGNLGAGREIMEGKHPKEVDLHYSTNNYDREGIGALYIAFVKMHKDITIAEVELLRVHQANEVLLEKVKGTNKYRLVGYSKKSFFFQDRYWDK